MLKNSKGEVFYGMHFYPGLARYQRPGQEPLTVFLNENTIRNMSPSFTGRPVFVEHKEDVNQDLDELRGEADGWVIESFFNSADGKTWAKFIVTSQRGLEAVRQGWRLSNAFYPESYKPGGMWNGIPYQKEVANGEFEHLAIVEEPRYEESVIMTPEQFKRYNDGLTAELKKLSNSKEKETMKFWKRAKIENAADVKDLGEVMVTLEKSKKDVTVKEAVEEYDKFLNMNGYANGDHYVKVGENEMTVNDLVKSHMEMANSMSEKEKAENAEDDDASEDGEGMENETQLALEEVKEEVDRGGDVSVHNEEDVEEDADEKEKPKAKKNAMKKNSKDRKFTIEEARELLKNEMNAREKAARLKNANQVSIIKNDKDAPVISLASDQVKAGLAIYGSGR